jgi:RNA polymerase sigma factor (sigma-70 family)
MLHIDTFLGRLPIIKTNSSKISRPLSAPVENTRKFSVLSAPKLSETRPEMLTHDAYLEGFETRKKTWAELAETPSLAEIKKFIQKIRAGFTPEQQEQLKKILAIGRTGLSEDTAFKEIRLTVTSNDFYEGVKKHLIELAQNLTIIREKVLEEQKNSPKKELAQKLIEIQTKISEEEDESKKIELTQELTEVKEKLVEEQANSLAREAFIKGINPLIQEAKLFALLDLGIINKITARYTRNDDSRLEQDDFRHAAIERLLISKDGNGFLGHVDIITSIDPNTGKPYIGTPLVDFYIKAGAIRELQNNGRTIRLPVHTHEKLNKLRKLAEAYSKLPDNETKPKFEEYYAQQTEVSIEKASSTLQELKMLGANILSLDKTSEVTFSDSRYGDESSTVAVELGNWIAQSEELSPEDIIDLSLLGADLKEVLGTLSPKEGDVLSLRYGLVDGQLKSLEELGRHFGVSRERIRQIEAKALRRLRQPRRRNAVRDHLGSPLLTKEDIAIRRANYLTQQAQDETIISETKQKNLHNETNVEASKKVLENYEALLKAQMQELLPDQNVLEELLKCEDPVSEVQAYSKTRTFKNRGEYEGFIKEFISLLTDYRQSKTREGKYEVLKGILNINNKEQSKLLLADIGLNKETGAK